MHAGEVVWYVTGRFYAQNDSLFDVGYFLHLAGMNGPMFNGAPGESTAHFTFSADPFTATNISNGALDIALDATGTFGIYFNEEPSASFDDPASFAKGLRIATFERVSVVAGVSFKTGRASVAMNVFTARLVSSTPFKYGDLRDVIPYGVTQWGTAASVPSELLQGYSAVVPFIGSAILAGS
jgi:hypothetical protein